MVFFTTMPPAATRTVPWHMHHAHETFEHLVEPNTETIQTSHDQPAFWGRFYALGHQGLTMADHPHSTSFHLIALCVDVSVHASKDGRMAPPKISWGKNVHCTQHATMFVTSPHSSRSNTTIMPGRVATLRSCSHCLMPCKQNTCQLAWCA